jgi:RNA polymerase sigma-70 factor (ECF subfamily)
LSCLYVGDVAARQRPCLSFDTTTVKGVTATISDDHRSRAGSGRARPGEDVLVRRAAGGDEQAFAALVRTHQDQAFLVALRLSGDVHLAEDLVQDAFIKAWRSLGHFRGTSSFTTWFTRILINTCHNARRRPPPIPVEPSESDVPAHEGADAQVIQGERHDAVRQALLSLPLDQRAPLVLFHFADLSHDEIGRILGISTSAAKVRVHRARRALVARLREWR